MLYLKEIGTAQTFKIIPRSYIADSMVIKNEYTNESTTYSISPLTSDYYMVITKIITLKQNQRYTLTVLNGSDIVYYGKIFCTNQTGGYSINDGEYIQHESNNDFIVIND